jgi:hypothetical protein
VIASGWQDDRRVWLEVVAAVDYLTDSHRPGLTVWDALDEAIRWWTAELVDPRDGFPGRRSVELPWSDPDPLRSSIEALLTVVPAAESLGAGTLGDVLAGAMAAWLVVMAEDFNEGHRFGAAEWCGGVTG